MKYSGFIVFAFLIMGTLFGIYGKIIVPDATANTVVPELMRLYMPPFIYGVILAGFFAAIMSSADTVLLILSMTLVHDLYVKTLKKPLSDKATLCLSRYVTFILGVMAIILAITVFNVVHLAIDAVSFITVLLPAVVFGFYAKEPSEPAAFWSIVAGFAVLIVFLFISPVEAFIPAIIASFMAYGVVAKICRK